MSYQVVVSMNLAQFGSHMSHRRLCVMSLRLRSSTLELRDRARLARKARSMRVIQGLFLDASRDTTALIISQLI